MARIGWPPAQIACVLRAMFADAAFLRGPTREAALIAHPDPFWPMPGTIHWRAKASVGIWGTPECPLRLHVRLPNGTIRPASRAERKLLDRLYGTDEQAQMLRRELGLAVVP